MVKYTFISIMLLLSILEYEVQAQERLGTKTYCNPMDIDYRYNWEQINQKISYRSGADPVIVFPEATGLPII
jgi:hypothetical protein